MNYKKTWTKKYGKSQIMTKENSSCKLVEIDMVRLADGQTKSYSEKDTEFGVLIFGGKCTVSGANFSFDKIGKREDVFGGAATCVYIPRNTDFTIKGEGEVSMCVTKSPAENDYEPVLINPEDVVIKDMGKPGWERQAHFILDERTKADIVYIGEAYVKGGQWASYPPHKHDDDNMPTEAATEEVYYYEFKLPQGFGIQKVYTMEGDIDETYTVKSGDLVEMPRGYHPFHSAPGYDSYYLWIMAGKNRGFFMTTDEDHAWLNK
ncbi:MAG: 5-deoxy-glucuronate isomerase [Clostridia bacterium]|nr:5-deoxy-glucuronate isomerase [Clostridia bacterium]